ncbi:MAG: hypothetical protein LBI04_09315, partial [Treponema sp.]|nr:hypothetical protein [Treponema sp.]
MNKRMQNDGAGACPVRDRILVENITHPINVVPSGTICMENIPSLTGRRIHRDAVSSTGIKSLTGLNPHRRVIGSGDYRNLTVQNDGAGACPVRDRILVENITHP